MSLLKNLASMGVQNTAAAASNSALGTLAGTNITHQSLGQQVWTDPYGNTHHASTLADVAQRERRAEAILKMLQDGDLVVRRVRNGYRVMRYASGGPGHAAMADEYVAVDMDAVHDVLKLAEVNSRIDAAK